MKLSLILPVCYRICGCSSGHLRLVRCLLTSEGIDVNEHLSVISSLLDDFLFPAAKLALCADSHDSLSDFSPKYAPIQSAVCLYTVWHWR